MTLSLAVLGCGNMASALVIPMKKHFPGLSVHTYTPSFTRAEKLASEVNGQAHKELKGIPECDLYMIACKPQQFSELAAEFKLILPKSATIVSILAGVTTARMMNELNNHKVVRVMPNTPSLVGHGVNALFFSSDVPDERREEVTQLFSSFSQVFTFDEEDKIDRITGFSGSGPAYVFEIARIMIEKMKNMGIEESVAEGMVKHTLYGSTKLLLESQDTPETLRNNVTSKKGVTYEALEVFKAHDLEGIFSQALDAAYKRSKELSQ